MISSSLWGRVDGKDVFLLKIVNQNGGYVELSNYGATVVSVVVPNRDGKLGHAVLGFSSLQGYVEDTCYIGSTIGRFANRISNAHFVLDGTDFQLDNNDGRHTNHGGVNGFNKKVFDLVNCEANSVVMSTMSDDMEEGFPGNLTLNISFEWTETNELKIRYSANTDRKTHLNLTNHCYFNLSDSRVCMEDHRISISSDERLELDAEYIPSGKILKEKSRIQKKIHRNINNYYIVRRDEDRMDQWVAQLYEPESGRCLSVYSSYPGLMLYTADFLQSRSHGHKGHQYGSFDGVCIECQYYPDSPNRPEFPSTHLKPGDHYNEYITYKFSVRT